MQFSGSTHLLFQLLALCFLGAVTPIASAGLFTVNFETDASGNAILDGTPLTGEFAAYGLTFQNATVLTSALGLNECEFPPHSPAPPPFTCTPGQPNSSNPYVTGNVVFDDGEPMQLMFAQPVSFLSGFFTYGPVPDGDTFHLVLAAFDAQNHLVTTVQSLFTDNRLESGAPHPPNELLSLSAAGGFSRVLLTYDPGGGSFTLDDLTFRPLVTAAVPEPGTAALVIPVLLALARSRRPIRTRNV